MPQDSSLPQINDNYLSSNSDSAKAIFSVVRTRQALSASEGSETTESGALLVEALGKSSTTLKDAIDGLALLKDLKGDAAQYTEEAKKRWPRAVAFEPKA